MTKRKNNPPPPKRKTKEGKNSSDTVYFSRKSPIRQMTKQKIIHPPPKTKTKGTIILLPFFFDAVFFPSSKSPGEKERQRHLMTWMA